MMKAFNQTVRYIEENLTEEINEKKVAYLSGYSYALFSRIFSIMTGYTLSEYIRLRKLTLAAEDLRKGKEKVIEIALKYGYESPDSFNTAFKKFHNISPSKVKNGAGFKVFSPLRLSLIIEGGNDMEVKIEKKQSFKIAGLKRKISDNRECPKLWVELFEKVSPEFLESIGTGECYGCCYNAKTQKDFIYMAAYDVKEEEKALKVGLEIVEISEAEYAVVKIKGAIPESIHNGWKYIVGTFFPENGYEHSGSPDFEYYYEGDMESNDYEMELWVPIVKTE